MLPTQSILRGAACQTARILTLGIGACSEYAAPVLTEVGKPAEVPADVALGRAPPGRRPEAFCNLCGSKASIERIELRIGDLRRAGKPRAPAGRAAPSPPLASKIGSSGLVDPPAFWRDFAPFTGMT